MLPEGAWSWDTFLEAVAATGAAWGAGVATGAAVGAGVGFAAQLAAISTGWGLAGTGSGDGSTGDGTLASLGASVTPGYAAEGEKGEEDANLRSGYSLLLRRVAAILSYAV